MKRIRIIATLVIANMLMATPTSRASLNLLRRSPKPKYFSSSSCQFRPSTFRKSYPCPIWSSSFSFCLPPPRSTTSTSLSSSFRPFSSPPSMSSAAAAAVDSVISEETLSSNPLLQDFDFPPFDSVDASHVRPGIRALLQHLVCSHLLLRFSSEIHVFFDSILIGF